MSAVLPARSANRGEHDFFTLMTLAMAATVFAGFARTFYLKAWFPQAQAMAAPEPVFYVHGVLFSLWPALLVTQALLVRRGHVGLHRRLGILGAPLAVAMVVLGLYVALVAANRPGGFIGIAAPPLQFLIVPVVAVLLFGIFVALALHWRRDPATHKRLMLLGTANMLDAAAARLPLPTLGPEGPPLGFFAPVLFVLALIGWDLASRRRLHPATLWGGLVTIAAVPGRMAVSETEAWLAIARRLTSLVS
jgi:uncharacterized membrane protein YozB (DUF420 family)